jgi:hypothetical protein
VVLSMVNSLHGVLELIRAAALRLRVGHGGVPLED